MINVKIKKISETATLPTYGSEKAAGMDIYADVDSGRVCIPAHETVLVHSGVSISPPDGYCAFIVARSGLATKLGLAPANKVGICDEDYTGEYMVALHNHSNEKATVEHGDRIAQILFMPYVQANLEVVEELDKTARGNGGFGSSGK